MNQVIAVALQLLCSCLPRWRFGWGQGPQGPAAGVAISIDFERRSMCLGKMSRPSLVFCDTWASKKVGNLETCRNLFWNSGSLQFATELESHSSQVPLFGMFAHGELGPNKGAPVTVTSGEARERQAPEFLRRNLNPREKQRGNNDTTY